MIGKTESHYKILEKIGEGRMFFFVQYMALSFICYLEWIRFYKNYLIFKNVLSIFNHAKGSKIKILIDLEI